MAMEMSDHVQMGHKKKNEQLQDGAPQIQVGL